MDIKTREVPDSISVLLLILGFVDTDIERLPSMLLGMVLVFLPQFVSALWTMGWSCTPFCRRKMAA